MRSGGRVGLLAGLLAAFALGGGFACNHSCPAKACGDPFQFDIHSAGEFSAETYEFELIVDGLSQLTTCSKAENQYDCQADSPTASWFVWMNFDTITFGVTGTPEVGPVAVEATIAGSDGSAWADGFVADFKVVDSGHGRRCPLSCIVADYVDVDW